MVIRDGDGLVLFNAAGMIGNGGTYKNYWGNYWTCPRCHRSWGHRFVGCGGCGGDSKEVAPSPVGADGWLDQQKLTEIVEAEGTYTTQGIGAVYTAIKPTAEEKLEAIRKIVEQFSWEYGSDPYVYADIKMELWDELLSLLRGDGG